MKIILILSLLSGMLLAADWPSYQHDNRRSGITSEQLNAANLTQKWVFTSKARPQPAWYGKMVRDSWSKRTFQADTFDYDKAFNLIAADGKVFFGSSSGNACVALNDVDGAEVWRVPVGGAVRVAPAYNDGKVYFGSDDGKVYCVNANNGSLIWDYRGGASATMIGNNQKFISRFPCRTGVMIEGGSAYCGFGLLTWHTNTLSKLNASTGVEEQRADKNGRRFSFEGILLSDGTNIFVTQGRNAPASFKLNGLSYNGEFPKYNGRPSTGATTATLSASGSLFHGPGHSRGLKEDYMLESNASDLTIVTAHKSVNRILINGSDRYALIRDVVTPIAGSYSWTQGIEKPVTMILAGTTLYVGAKNQVIAIDSTSGTVLKILPVDGTAYSLAVANGKLFASTTTGKIYAFSE